jgi:hypothetical protein
VHGYCLSLYANVGNTIKQARVKTMELKAHLYRLENIKAIHDLKSRCGSSCHFRFLTAEGIELSSLEVTNIVNTYDELGKEKLPSKKVQALINAKKIGQEDENLPCPV